MALSASQWRLTLVVIATCVGVNLLLYTSAVFSATRTQQIDTGREMGPDQDTDDSILLTLRSLQGRGSKNIISVEKSRVEKGRLMKHLQSRYDYGHLSSGGRYGRRPEKHKNGLGKQTGKGLLIPSSTSTPRPDFNGTTPKVEERKLQSGRQSNEDFNLEKALRLFQGCIEYGDNISLDCFNDGYQELNKIFRPLGSIFSFVISEVEQKISILREYRQDPHNGLHFRTVQSMVRYEMDHKLTVQDDKPSASRTFLRLHWALQFISALVARMKEPAGGKLSELVTQAYDATLALHHPWYMRQAVHLATYSLPSRKEVLEKLHIQDTPHQMAQVQALIDQMNAIYQIAQEVYEENHLLDLP